MLGPEKSGGGTTLLQDGTPSNGKCRIANRRTTLFDDGKEVYGAGFGHVRQVAMKPSGGARTRGTAVHRLTVHPRP